MTVTLQAQLEEHNRRIEGVCPMGNVALWKTIKGVIYALLVTVNALVGIYMGAAHVWLIAIVAMLSLLLILGVEVKEIQVADWFSVTFKGDGRERDEDGE